MYPLSIYMTSLKTQLFRSFAHFSSVLLSSLLWLHCMSSLYDLEMNPLSDITVCKYFLPFQKLSFHSVGCFLCCAEGFQFDHFQVRPFIGCHCLGATPPNSLLRRTTGVCFLLCLLVFLGIWNGEQLFPIAQGYSCNPPMFRYRLSGKNKTDCLQSQGHRSQGLFHMCRALSIETVLPMGNVNIIWE